MNKHVIVLPLVALALAGGAFLVYLGVGCLRAAPAMAHEKGLLSAEELDHWRRKEALRRHVIKVDDFPQDFGRAEISRKLAEEQAALAAKAA